MCYALRLPYTGAGDHRHAGSVKAGRSWMSAREPGAPRLSACPVALQRPFVRSPVGAQLSGIRRASPAAALRATPSIEFAWLRQSSSTSCWDACRCDVCRCALPCGAACDWPLWCAAPRLARPSRGAARRPLGQSPPVKGAVMSRCVSRSHRQS